MTFPKVILNFAHNEQVVCKIKIKVEYFGDSVKARNFFAY